MREIRRRAALEEGATRGCDQAKRSSCVGRRVEKVKMKMKVK